MQNFDKLFNTLMEAHVGVRSSNPERDLEVGLATEAEFVKICEQNKLVCQQSTKQEDMFDKFDFRVFKRNRDKAWADRPENARNQKSCNYVEVKGQKLLKGTTDKILIEVRNVSSGIGWLYGKANYIALKKLDDVGFRMIPRYNLMIELEKMCNFTKTSDNEFFYKDNKQPVKETKDAFQSTIKDEEGRCVFYNRGEDLVIYVPDSFIEQMKAFELLPKR